MKSISIIVPIYKGEKYINKIIQSVENNYSYCTANGMDVKIEIIFVNDSPENWKEITEEEARIIIKKQEEERKRMDEEERKRVEEEMRKSEFPGKNMN